MTLSAARQDHAQLMHELAARHDALLPLLRGRPLVLLDVPVYGNIGDLLIDQGTRRWLRRRGLRLLAEYSVHAYRPRSWPPGTVLLLSGGGNFGDRYELHQQFREAVVVAHPQQRIIILPQSVDFCSAAAQQRSGQLLSQHADLLLCVRDQHSQQQAQAMGLRSLLLPDMAHQLYPLRRLPAWQPLSGRGRLLLRRSDAEAAACVACVLPAQTMSDWPRLLRRERPWLRCFSQAQVLWRRCGVTHLLNPVAARLWQRWARHLVGSGVALFARHQEVASNRLHGHILACLLDQPQMIFDNNYGKNSRYIHCWTKGSPLLQWCGEELPAQLSAPGERAESAESAEVALCD